MFAPKAAISHERARDELANVGYAQHLGGSG
jgi:hypothetical protein